MVQPIIIVIITIIILGPRLPLHGSFRSIDVTIHVSFCLALAVKCAENDFLGSAQSQCEYSGGEDNNSYTCRESNPGSTAGASQ